MKIKQFLLIIALLLTPCFAFADGLEPDMKHVNSDALKVKDTDFAIGSAKAPVTIIEYSSLTCPHCAHFHKDAFSKLNEEYIKHGKVRYVLRDFPLNAPALLAAKIAHCAGKDRYFDFIKTFFEWQDIWAFTQKYPQEIEKIAALGGIAGEKYKACSQNKAIENFIIGREMEANKELNIAETPTFFINGEKYTGGKDYAFFKKAIDAKLKKK